MARPPPLPMMHGGSLPEGGVSGQSSWSVTFISAAIAAPYCKYSTFSGGGRVVSAGAREPGAATVSVAIAPSVEGVTEGAVAFGAFGGFGAFGASDAFGVFAAPG